MNCIICGTVRNVGRHIDKVYANMILISKLFSDYEIILFYDISEDNTLHKLVYYNKLNPKFTFHVNREPLHELRTHRLSIGRNYLMEQIDAKKDRYPLFIMMDCDDVCNGNININLLKNSLRRMNEWDSLSFWGNNRDKKNTYYDVWALSIYPYVLPFNYFHDIATTLSKRRNYINNLNKRAKKTNSYIPCYSAFCGFAIYKTEKFVDCRYDGSNKLTYLPKSLVEKNVRVETNMIPENDILNYNEDCEHRYFHFKSILKHNSKIRISPYYLFT
jgi:hypothetical protein